MQGACAGNGEAVGPDLFLLFRKIQAKCHGKAGNRNYDKGKDTSGKSKQTISRNKAADVAPI